jgi:hypothetical protein
LTQGSNRARIAIAIIGVIGSLGVAIIKGHFDRTHIDDRLSNLSGIDIEVGAWGAGYADKGWNLGSPDDHSIPKTMRIFRMPIKFSHQFTKEPKILLSVSGIDIANDANFRWFVDSEDTTTEGFTIKLTANENFKVYFLSGQWFAYQQ